MAASLNISDDRDMIEYYRDVKLRLTLQEIVESKLVQIAIEHTSLKFAIGADQMKVLESWKPTNK